MPKKKPTPKKKPPPAADGGSDLLREEKAGREALAKFLQRVASFGTVIAGELRFPSNHPQTSAVSARVLANAKALRALAGAVMLEPGTSLDILAGYGVRPEVLISAWGCNHPSRGCWRAVEYMVGLAEYAVRTIETGQVLSTNPATGECDLVARFDMAVGILTDSAGSLAAGPTSPADIAKKGR